jgi:hypothetical protein
MSAGIATTPVAIANQVVPASVPSPSECATEATQATELKRCSLRQRAWPMRPRA